ncbi:TPA: hypothetical protein ACKP2V_000114 [Pseudomonas putida]
MRYDSLEQFSKDIKNADPDELISRWIATEHPHAFFEQRDYNLFRDKIFNDWPSSDLIAIAGSGNWRYSLNPRNDFREFHSGSDIDVIIISNEYFDQTWKELRLTHRKLWIRWSGSQRESVLRTGQNVYCGFVSPKHIPDKYNRYKFDFLQKCNSYSGKTVDYREVNLMFFKSIEETIDYYTRGIRLAKGKL